MNHGDRRLVHDAFTAAYVEHAAALSAAVSDQSDPALRRVARAELVLAQRCQQAAPLSRAGSEKRHALLLLAQYLTAEVNRSRFAREVRREVAEQARAEAC